MRRNGFSQKQVEWVRNRDGHKCQLCGSTQDCHVHHITPFRFGTAVLGWSVERVNSPFNAILVCAACHIGKQEQNYSNAIHPDTEFARRMYAEDRRSFDRMMRERDELCRAGQRYWNPLHDNEMAQIALCNTVSYIVECDGEIPW